MPWADILPWIYAGTFIVVGFILASILSRLIKNRLAKRARAQQAMIFSKVVYFFILLVFAIGAMQQLGFKLSVLLGTAGVLTLAIGFASQTSVANIISGLFLIVEKSFQVGDVITVNGTTGTVLSIDLLSVKLKTFDNTYVRVPNDSLIKTQITNFTHFPLRRFDLQLGVSYSSDIEHVRKTLEKTAKSNAFCLHDPAPQFYFLGFGDSTINLQFSTWAKKEDFGKLKLSLQQEIKHTFEQEKIDIPFPQMVVHQA